MPIDPKDFLAQVVKPTLTYLAGANPRLHTRAAEELLLGTAMVESNLEHFKQLGNGPARSPFQIEPTTLHDIYNRYLANRNPRLFVPVDRLLWPGDTDPSRQLQFNLRFACAIARMKYYESPLALPMAGDWRGHAKMWKKVYNTAKGAGKIQHFEAATEGIKSLW